VMFAADEIKCLQQVRKRVVKKFFKRVILLTKIFSQQPCDDFVLMMHRMRSLRVGSQSQQQSDQILAKLSIDSLSMRCYRSFGIVHG
jgi:hypothetical protein